MIVYKLKKIAILAAFVLLAFSFCVLRGEQPATAAISPENVALAGPAQIYAAHCAACHGADGRARTAKGKRAGATDLTSNWNRDEGRGIRIITNGKDEMPSFKKKLTAAEIRSVFSYVVRF